MFKGGQDHNVPSSLAHHQMLLDTRNKNIYGVGISTKGTGPLHMVMTYIPSLMLLDTRIYKV
jgi:hypothetical protein